MNRTAGHSPFNGATKGRGAASMEAARNKNECRGLRKSTLCRQQNKQKFRSWKFLNRKNNRWGEYLSQLDMSCEYSWFCIPQNLSHLRMLHSMFLFGTYKLPVLLPVKVEFYRRAIITRIGK